MGGDTTANRRQPRRQSSNTAASSTVRPTQSGTAVTPRKSPTRRAEPAKPTVATRRFSIGVMIHILLTAIAILVVGSLLVGIVSIVAAYAFVQKDLPSPENLGTAKSFKTARILDRHDRLLYEIIDPNGGRRTAIRLGDMARPMQLATIAVEDATFYVNPGVDLRAIVRAVWLDVRSNQVVSGGSTITQQLVKNKLLTSEPSLQRKFKEAILAWEVSRRYSKEQLLEMYLNEVYYGNMAYGVEAAANTYFGHSAKDLDLAESAFLAGLVQSPADYDPFADFAAAKERQGVVLDLMAKYGLIAPQEAETAKAAKLPLRRAAEAVAVPLRAPHFAMLVRDFVEKTYGQDLLYHGGLEIRTTLDLDLQEAAEATIQEHLAKIKNLNANDAALVAIDPSNGEVLAMVGSADFFDDAIKGQINMAVSRRQAGSTLKPFVYLTGFAKGYNPATILQDVDTTFPGGYHPLDHDKKFRGPVRAREALANSLNVPAVQMLQMVGIGDALATMHRMGITDLTDSSRYGLALALGSGEVKLLDLTFAYTAFANNGMMVGEPVSVEQRKPGLREIAPAVVLHVADGSGRTLYDYHPSQPKQVTDPRLAYLITSILSDDTARSGTYGRHSFLELSRPSAAKTGTTDDFRDGWTVGYTPDLVTGVWVGNADNSPMLDVYGVSGAGYIWHTFNERVLKGLPLRPFTRPPGVVDAKVCADTGQPATPACTHQIDEVFAGDPATPAITPATGRTPAPLNSFQVSITSPATGTTAYGIVEVVGSAAAPAPVSYTLQYAPASAPKQWVAIVADRPLSVVNNFLGRWDTTMLAAGSYTVQLLVVGKGGAIQTAQTVVNVAQTGPLPAALANTPTPTPPNPARATTTPSRATTPASSPTSTRRTPSPTAAKTAR